MTDNCLFGRETMEKSRERLLIEKYDSLHHISDLQEFKKDLRQVMSIIDSIEQETPEQLRQQIKEKYIRTMNSQLVKMLKDVPIDHKEIDLFSEEEIQTFINSPLTSEEFGKILDSFKARKKRAFKVQKSAELMTEFKTPSYLNSNVISQDERSGNATYFKIVEGTLKPAMLSDFATAIRTNTIRQLSELKECFSAHGLQFNELADRLDQVKTISSNDRDWHSIEDKLRSSWSKTTFKSNRIFIERLLDKLHQKTKA